MTKHFYKIVDEIDSAIKNLEKQNGDEISEFKTKPLMIICLKNFTKINKQLSDEFDSLSEKEEVAFDDLYNSIYNAIKAYKNSKSDFKEKYIEAIEIWNRIKKQAIQKNKNNRYK